MRVKKVTIEITDKQKIYHEFKTMAAAVMRGEKVRPKEVISFANIEVFRRFFTENRLNLLKVIKKEKPESIYTLAKLVKRDFKNVHQDLQILKDFGLVELTKDQKNKKRLKPSLLYSGLNLHFSF